MTHMRKPTNQGLDLATLAKLSLNLVLVPVVGEVLNVHLWQGSPEGATGAACRLP